MNKHLIERPKKPVCFETANMVVMFACMIILFFLNIFLFSMFFVAMIVFCVISISDFKHYPEATLYIKGNTLNYYKKGLTRIKLKDIKECKVAFDKKNKPYVDITYLDEKEVDNRLVIKEDNSEFIVNSINESIKAMNEEHK